MQIAILGAGAMGTHVAEVVRNNSAVEKVICHDRSQERIEELCGKGFYTEANLDNIMSNPDVNLVFVTASNDAHLELTARALCAGKAVMCEKPMANTLDDTIKMVEAAEKENGWLQIGFELRYSLLYTKIKEWINKGLLGKIVNTSCVYIASARAKDNWRNKKEYCGSLFSEKLSHYVDLPRWWIGDRVEEIYTLCAHNTIPYYETHDNYHTSFRFNNGAVSHITFMMSPASHFDGDPLQNVVDQQKEDGHELRYIVVGDKGAAETDVFGRSIKRWEFHDDTNCLKSRLTEELTWDKSQDHCYFHNTSEQANDIIRRVREGIPPKTPASDSLETMKLCFAAEKSAELGRPVFLEEL